MKLRSLFTSRWMALAWSVLICLYAIQYVGPGKSASSAHAKPAAHGQTQASNGNAADETAAEANGATKAQVDAVLKAFN